MTIKICSDSILGNTANDTAGFSFKNTLYLAGCDRILVILSMILFKALNVPKNHFGDSFRTPPSQKKTHWVDNEKHIRNCTSQVTTTGK